MDLLKKELERKKKALQSASNSEAVIDTGSEGRCRYIQVGKLRRLQHEQEEQERLATSQRKTNNNDNDEQQAADKNVPDKQKQKKRPRTDNRDTPEAEKATGNIKDMVAGFPLKQKKNKSSTNDSETWDKDSRLDDSSQKHKASTLTSDDVTRELRALGMAVRLFGEEESSRLMRLQQAFKDRKEKQATASEMEEFRLVKGHGIRNPFLDKKTANTAGTDEKLAAAAADAPTTNEAANPQVVNHRATKGGDGEHDTDDPHKRIYRYFKGLLREWEDDLTKRPDDVKRSVAGRNETKTLKQCKDYIHPLFKLCKNRKLEQGLMGKIVNIVDYCQQGEFVKAHDAYMDVAIGRAAWPIGVTMVGIHARTGRSKIESQNVAHVMNSELQRKYLTSVKRLMTFAQQKRTDVAPSKKVIN